MGRILAGIGIVVNLFVPGVGSLIMGKWTTGAVQVGVLAVVWLLKLISFGLLGYVLWPVSGVIWVWALVGGILTYVERGHRDALGQPRY
jgi:TM2 domain-containing membrane protein YozV